MKAAPFLLILAILFGSVAIAFEVATSPAEDSGAVAERPTVTPRQRATSPARPAEGAATPGFAEGGAVVPPMSQPQQATPSLLPTAAPTGTPVASPSPTATPAPSPSPTPTQANAPATGQTLRVGNTDGQGVFLRRTPQMNDKVRPWLDGTPMVVVGPSVAGDGHTWQHVRAPDGTEGYIPSEYLVGN